MIITIDGPGGSGKSTIAKKLAEQLDFVHIDTGAMYRAISWYLLRNNIDLSSLPKISEALSHIKLKIEKSGGLKRYFINDIDVTKDIRSVEITNIVSRVAAIPMIREFLVEKQRELAQNQDVVCEGRDIGSVVFPKAELKIFLDADPQVRAKRRYKELLEKFPSKKDLSEDMILQDIKQRDHLDSTRAHSPLIMPEKAFLIDTSYLTIEEVIGEIKQKYNEIKKR